MGFFTSSLLVGVSVFGLSSLCAGDAQVLRGTSVYSFSDPYFLLQTGKYVYSIKKSWLSLKQVKALNSVGSHVSVKIDPAWIETAWSYQGEVTEGEKNSFEPSAPPYAKFENNAFFIRGTVIPWTYGDDCMIRVGEIIYKVHTRCTGAETPTVEVKTDGNGVDFAWAVNGEQPVNRMIASVSPNSGYSSAPSEGVSYRDDHVLIRGQLLYSFLKPYYWIMANDKIYQIKKNAIRSRHKRLESSIGSYVSLNVPKYAVESSWNVSSNSFGETEKGLR